MKLKYWAIDLFQVSQIFDRKKNLKIFKAICFLSGRPVDPEQDLHSIQNACPISEKQCCRSESEFVRIRNFFKDPYPYPNPYK